MITRTICDSGEPFAFAFSEPEWATVVAVSPPADAFDLDAERKALEHVATAYLNLVHHHRIRSKAGFPTKARQKKQRQIADEHLMAVGAELRAELRAELAHADAAVEGWGVLGRMHQGRKNPARDWLCDATLAMWMRLSGSMRISRPGYGRDRPRGAAITFMTTVLTLVMQDDTPGAEALALLVKKARRRVPKKT